MEVVQKTAQKFIVRIPADESFANAIRRSVSEIPVLAIDEVEIFKNDSALYDEVLAHRLGLIPLKTEKSMNDKTKIEFKLSKVGPCTVYASDLDGPVEIVYPKIPITLLEKDKKLELVATATLGKGIEHAKYLPGICFYRHLVDVKSNPEIEKIIQNSKGFVKQKKGNTWRCDLTDKEIDSIQKINKEAVTDSDELLMIIESFGQMDAKEIFVKALNALEENLAELEKSLK